MIHIRTLREQFAFLSALHGCPLPVDQTGVDQWQR